MVPLPGISGFGSASFLAASPVSCSGKDFVSSPLLFLAGFGLVGSLDVRYNFHLFSFFRRFSLCVTPVPSFLFLSHMAISVSGKDGIFVSPLVLISDFTVPLLG